MRAAAANHTGDDAREAMFDALSPALVSLKTLLRGADEEALAAGAISEGTTKFVRAEFARFERLLNDTIGDSADAMEDAKSAVGARVQTELHPYMLLSATADRWYAKPRGYAGDYLSIAHVYDEQPRGAGRIGALVDRCFLDLAAARAVRNRRPLLAREIRAAVERAEGGRARVTSLACGPAAELFDAFESLPDGCSLHAVALDMDIEALAHVGARRDAKRMRRSIDLVNENLVYLAAGRRHLDLRNQDLVYSVGLIDYFDDDFVVRLMNFAYATLRPGGRVLLGNFHPSNPTKAVLDHVLDWKLVHRTEADLDRLYRASAFGRDSTRVIFEEEGINLFAECIREHA